MIGYVTIGTDDLERSRGFYDALLEAIGAKRLMELENGFTLYGSGVGKAGLAVKPPYNGEAADPGNGNMVALGVNSRDKVDRLHARALELGGSDEGGPGLRGPQGPSAFYGAYFRDLDRNKLCVFCMGPAQAA